MSAHLAKRIKRAEAAVLPPPMKKIKMLTEPLASASDAERAKYAQELAEAEAECDLVIILSALKPLRQFQEGKRLMVGTEAEQLLAMAANSPSEKGNANALEDVLKSLPGNVMGVAQNPPPARREW